MRERKQHFLSHIVFSPNSDTNTRVWFKIQTLVSNLIWGSCMQKRTSPPTQIQKLVHNSWNHTYATAHTSRVECFAQVFVLELGELYLSWGSCTWVGGEVRSTRHGGGCVGLFCKWDLFANETCWESSAKHSKRDVCAVAYVWIQLLCPGFCIWVGGEVLLLHTAPPA